MCCCFGPCGAVTASCGFIVQCSSSTPTSVASMPDGQLEEPADSRTAMLVNQVLLVSDVPCQHIRPKHTCQLYVHCQGAQLSSFFNSQQGAVCHCASRGRAGRATNDGIFTDKIAVTQYVEDCFLPSFGLKALEGTSGGEDVRVRVFAGQHPAGTTALGLHLKAFWFSATPPSMVRSSKPNVSRLAPDVLLSHYHPHSRACSEPVLVRHALPAGEPRLSEDGPAWLPHRRFLAALHQRHRCGESTRDWPLAHLWLFTISLSMLVVVLAFTTLTG